MPHSVTYSMGVSLDGYAVAPDGGLDWATPDDEVFRFALDQLRGVDVHLLGRRLHETMLSWESVDPDSLGATEREWAALWNPLPKVVFSRTLDAVRGPARLATSGVAAEIARWRAEPGEGEIAIGGPTLAVQAARLGLVDEYRPRVHPVLLGSGVPFFPREQRRQDLELLETRTFACGVVHLRYGVRGR